LVRPPMTHATGFPIPLWVQLWVPPTTVTVNPKPCIVEPPLNNGRVNVTFTEPAENGVATRFVGASGTVAGTTFGEATETAEVPAAFEAVTVNVYVTPFVRPVTTQLVVSVVQTTSPATGPANTTPAEVTVAEATVTTKLVTEAPPLLTGAIQETVVEPFWNDVPVTPVGAPGTVAGVTEPEATEGSDEPISFEATTVNVYAVPLVRPAIVHDNSTVSHITTPSPLVITYPVTGEPPVEAGANHDNVIVESPETPMTLVGANGTVASAPATTGADTVAAEEPTPLVTTTLNV